MNTHVPHIHSPEQREAPPVRAAASSGNGVDDGQSKLEFVSAGREATEFAKASRHSSRVRRLKIILPVIAAIVVIGFIGAVALRNVSLPDIQIGGLNLDDGKLVMEHPQLSGTDAEKRPYSLTAEKAIQDLSKPKSIELNVITAKLPMENGVYADITADKGVYDADKKTLIMDGKVTLKTDNGMKIDLVDVNVDIAVGSLETSNPVSLKTESANIVADSLRVEKNGELIIFEKRVRMTLDPSGIKKPAENGQ